MQLRRPADIGQLIREHRRQQGLDQAELAQRIHVSRQWVVEVEKGKPRAEIGLILRALNALGLYLSAQSEAQPSPLTTDKIPSIDIDAVLDDLRQHRP